MNESLTFPRFRGLRCLMMPYIQGEPESVPREYTAYSEIIRDVFVCKGDIGYLTIDESVAVAGKPHRGKRAKTPRALHTEAGIEPRKIYCWGAPTPGWGSKHHVTLDRDVQILLANNLDDTCAVWDATHEDTSIDGDIGYAAELYPYENAWFMKASEVRRIGILTPATAGERCFRLPLVGAGRRGDSRLDERLRQLDATELAAHGGSGKGEDQLPGRLPATSPSRARRALLERRRNHRCRIAKSKLAT